MASGKRAGARRAEKVRGTTLPTLGYALAITACIDAWGYLVFAAIDFGTSARAGGTSASWWFLALATLGAVGCLFVGLLVGARLLRSLGVTPTAPAGTPPIPQQIAPRDTTDAGPAVAAPALAPGRRRALR